MLRTLSIRCMDLILETVCLCWKLNMFVENLKSSVFLVSLLALSVSSEEEEDLSQCTFINWESKAPPCPQNYTEMYREDIFDLFTSRLCCPTGSKVEKEQSDIAYTCRTTPCQSFSASGNLCSTLIPRFVGNSKLSYEETLRDTCALENARPGDEVGITAMCCVHNSTSGYLLTTYGAERNEFPHMAALSVGCGGTVYNKRYIITAAHCVVGVEDGRVKSPEGMKVTLGLNIGGHGGDSLSKSNTYQAEKLIAHEGYSGLEGSDESRRPAELQRIFNDVALIKLDRDIEFGPKVKALEIAKKGFQPMEYADNAVIAGWGTTDNGQVTQALQKANFRIRPDEKCFRNNGTWKNYEGVDEQLLCVGGILQGTYSPTAGGGDSGGPAICRGQDGKIVLCGVTSFGGISDMDCAAKVNAESCPPSVYAEVAHFSDWIQKHAGEQDEKTLYKPYLYGERVAPKKYEHQVHITSSSGKPCGGTLISQDTVITAAQCVADPDTRKAFSDIKVATGIRDLNAANKAKVYGVKKAAFLEGFKREGKKIDPETNGVTDEYKRVIAEDSPHHNDLALLKLDGKVEISEKNLPEIPSLASRRSILANEVAFPRNTSRSGLLLQREFELLGFAECQIRLDRMQRGGLDMKVDNNILCGVETYSGGSLCDRELGGGLFCKGKGSRDVLCGVQVFRFCEWSVPNGFISLALYKDWVDSTMKQL